jgi:hypothetical protein
VQTPSQRSTQRKVLPRGVSALDTGEADRPVVADRRNWNSGGCDTFPKLLNAHLSADGSSEFRNGAEKESLVWKNIAGEADNLNEKSVDQMAESGPRSREGRIRRELGSR